jgi:hypothetical protein
VTESCTLRVYVRACKSLINIQRFTNISATLFISTAKHVCDRDHKNWGREQSSVRVFRQQMLTLAGDICFTRALGYFQDVIKGLFVAKESVFVVDFHAFAPRVMAKVQIAVL